MKTDSQLQDDVMEELKYEPRVDHAHIGVTAQDGIVTLTGYVPNYSQKISAEQAVRRVSGVKGIAEEIKVRFPSDPKTTDAEIAKRILDMLDWNTTLPRKVFNVKVEQGWVTLSGKVEWNYQKQSAFKSASKVAGVKGITNQIEVRVQPAAPDIRKRIVDAFQRSSAIDANSINVVVENNTVKLSGKVRGWNERKVAESAAWLVPGVTRVEDNIILA
jgi:osmotically-inducible protein OsmY